MTTSSDSPSSAAAALVKLTRARAEYKSRVSTWNTWPSRWSIRLTITLTRSRSTLEHFASPRTRQRRSPITTRSSSPTSSWST
ncbi:MAG: hypothetical protein ACRD0S_11300, partial [Acidimicrobiales bacterium]